MRAPQPRPRVVTAAFWCWLVASILTTAFGLLQLTQNAPIFFRLVGALLMVVGLGQGYLTGRARKGDVRYIRAAVALAMTSVVLLALLTAIFGVSLPGLLAIAVIMALMIAGTVLMTRPAAASWADQEPQ
jgi:hypothetical protein